jgi:hypothetical protein
MDRVFLLRPMGLRVAKDGFESPLALVRIVDRFGCVHNCKWLDVELNILGESRLLLFGSGNIYSAFGNFELLPAEEAGIDRPGAGSDHREGGAKGR